jgi:hypothetical protein
MSKNRITSKSKQAPHALPAILGGLALACGLAWTSTRHGPWQLVIERRAQARRVLTGLHDMAAIGNDSVSLLREHNAARAEGR